MDWQIAFNWTTSTSRVFSRQELGSIHRACYQTFVYQLLSWPAEYEEGGCSGGLGPMHDREPVARARLSKLREERIIEYPNPDVPASCGPHSDAPWWAGPTTEWTSWRSIASPTARTSEGDRSRVGAGGGAPAPFEAWLPAPRATLVTPRDAP